MQSILQLAVMNCVVFGQETSSLNTYVPHNKSRIPPRSSSFVSGQDTFVSHVG